jgi:acyl-CoA synthetase (AMP-forming)/AMP-acid ligase II
MRLRCADIAHCHAADGYYWITGRVDDVINVSGHRIGTAEVESALVLHDLCAEAAVVGFEHPIKGQGIYAFVTLMDGIEFTDDVKKALVMCVLRNRMLSMCTLVLQPQPGLQTWVVCCARTHEDACAGVCELKLDLSQHLMLSTGHLDCRRLEAARSCAEYCARWRLARQISWETYPPWRTHP